MPVGGIMAWARNVAGMAKAKIANSKPDAAPRIASLDLIGRSPRSTMLRDFVKRPCLHPTRRPRTVQWLRAIGETSASGIRRNFDLHVDTQRVRQSRHVNARRQITCT